MKVVSAYFKQMIAKGKHCGAWKILARLDRNKRPSLPLLNSNLGPIGAFSVGKNLKAT